LAEKLVLSPSPVFGGSDLRKIPGPELEKCRMLLQNWQSLLSKE